MDLPREISRSSAFIGASPHSTRRYWRFERSTIWSRSIPVRSNSCIFVRSS